jgi:hypothetical protein
MRQSILQDHLRASRYFKVIYSYYTYGHNLSSSLMEKPQVAEETRARVEKLLKDENRENEETMERVNILLESQTQDKASIESLKKQLEETERKLKLAHDERKIAQQVSSQTRERDAKQSQAQRKELEKAEKAVSQLQEQITVLQESLQAAEDGRQTSLNALKSDGHAHLENEMQARLEDTERKLKLAHDERKIAQQVSSQTRERDAKQSRAQRKELEKAVADMSDAKQGRLKAEAEIIKTRRTWSFISFLIFFVAFVGASNEYPMQNLMQSFNETLSNLVPDSETKTNPVAQNDRQMTKDSKHDDARMKQEAATQAKIAADLKDAEEAKQKAQAEKDAAQKAKKETELLARQKATQAKIAADLKDAEEAKQKAETEKDAAQKAKKEAELLARQKADGETRRREVRAFQIERNTVDEMILLW